MKQLAIIGAGQLGSRHLQALATVRFDATIFVVDPSENSRTIAESRFHQITTRNASVTANFVSSIQDLPAIIDFAVVATNADIRFSVLEQLLDSVEVNAILLEKVLFQTVAEYKQAEDLIREKGARVWVNCPRRMYPLYQDLLPKYLTGPLELVLEGVQWGLGCNSIHYIDLLAFLGGGKHYTLSTSGLDSELQASKRAGFLEFTGAVTGVFENGDQFSLTSNKGDVPSNELKLLTPQYSITLKEGIGVCEIVDRSTGRQEILNFTPLFQSGLTNLVVEQVLEQGTAPLTTYAESKTLHLPFIEALLNHMAKTRGETSTICPIT